MNAVCVCNLLPLFDQVGDEHQVLDEQQVGDFEQVQAQAQEEDQEEDQEEHQEEKKEPCNIHESIANPLGSQTFGECPVCYEELTMINVTITRCGHVMHSSCIFTALEAAPCCPMCRTQLMRDLEDEDEDEEDQDEEEDDEDDEDQDDEDQDEDEGEEHDSEVSLEKLSAKLQNMGYTLTDFLSVWLSHSNLKKENPEKYNKELEDKLADDVFGILDGSIPLSSRDKRTYAAVVRENSTV
uniref:RING-type domain-containing protein n=1 Tax=viral metagenome TaxID=1070528 RepID=A0A6C0BAC2_9ZZZZ